MSTVLQPVRREYHIVCLEGPLQVPHAGELDRKVRTLVRDGERRIVLDLSGVSAIDAGGIGGLMRAHRLIGAIDGVLRIAHANRWVREPLRLVGVLGFLSNDD
jgi:anti-anti-sigma factor